VAYVRSLNQLAQCGIGGDHPAAWLETTAKPSLTAGLVDRDGDAPECGRTALALRIKSGLCADLDVAGGQDDQRSHCRHRQERPAAATPL
jgi:hypothetical protein